MPKSRQQRWNERNREKMREVYDRYNHSPKGFVRYRRYDLKRASAKCEDMLESLKEERLAIERELRRDR